MEDDLGEIAFLDEFEEPGNVDEVSPVDEAVSVNSTDDVIRQVQQSARSAVQLAHGHENLTFLEHRMLHDGPRVKKVAQAVIVRRHADDTYKGMYLVYEVWRRPSKSQPFHREDRINLDIDTTAALLEYLHEAEASADVISGMYVVLPAAEAFDNLDSDQQQTFAHLLEDLTKSHRVAGLLASGQLTSEAIDNLAAAARQAKYKAEYAELEAMVSGKGGKTKHGGAAALTEHTYQRWFEEHTWVFGTEYLRRINLRAIDTHATVDFILATPDGFADVLELKTPAAPVLLPDKSHNTWYWTPDVAKVIAQAAKYIHAIEQNTDTIYRYAKIALVRPRVRVVIGRSNEWTEEQHEAFRRLSATLHGIELLTFDHVMIRAQQLINYYEQHPDIPMVDLAVTADEEQLDLTSS